MYPIKIFYLLIILSINSLIIKNYNLHFYNNINRYIKAKTNNNNPYSVLYFRVNQIDQNEEVQTIDKIKSKKQIDFIVRYACYHELPNVCKLRTHVFYPQNVAITSFQNRTLEKLRNRVDQGSICLIATANNVFNIYKYPEYMYFGDLLGTVEISPNDFINTPLELYGSNRKLYVADLAVREDARRQGIATRLLNEIEAYAKQTHYNEIYLHVEVNNTNAKDLYFKRGYNELPMDDNVKSFTESRLQNNPYLFILLWKQVLP